MFNIFSLDINMSIAVGRDLSRRLSGYEDIFCANTQVRHAFQYAIHGFSAPHLCGTLIFSLFVQRKSKQRDQSFGKGLEFPQKPEGQTPGTVFVKGAPHFRLIK
jgi:hypothetical protein